VACLNNTKPNLTKRTKTMLPIQQKQSKSYKDMPNLIALNGQTYSKDFLFLAYVSDIRNNFEKYNGFKTSFQNWILRGAK